MDSFKFNKKMKLNTSYDTATASLIYDPNALLQCIQLLLCDDFGVLDVGCYHHILKYCASAVQA